MASIEANSYCGPTPVSLHADEVRVRGGEEESFERGMSFEGGDVF